MGSPDTVCAAVHNLAKLAKPLNREVLFVADYRLEPAGPV